MAKDNPLRRVPPDAGDTQAKRWALAPFDPVRIEHLQEMGVIELANSEPSVAEAVRKLIERA